MNKIKSVYIHIPFCQSKCNYCDFISLPLAGNERLFQRYPALLASELELWREEADFSRLVTVYFGGGTPSLLPPAAVGGLLALFPPAGEITLEANPESLDPAKLQSLLRAGVNRLSIGVQSFRDHLLAAMGRRHSAAQATDAVRQARAAGFANISLDLIYGLPGQDMAMWQEDLRRALELETQHISLYGLSLHERTCWGRRLAQGLLLPVDDDLAADMLETAIDTLRAAGFRHYEISNFARPGYESRHNMAYWQRENYLGLGAAAASCLLNHRWSNTRDVAEYAAAIEAGQLPMIEDEALTIDQVMAEAIFLGLRLTAGVDFAAFERQYGISPAQRFRKQLARLTKLGLLDADAQGMRLTRRGLLLGNEVFAEFI